MRAQRRHTGTEKACSCAAAVKQSCENKGRYLICQAKTRELFWPQGVREVLSNLRSSALGVLGRNSSGKRLPGAGQALALPGKIPRSCQPPLGLRGAGKAQQPVTREPSLLPQATQAPMDPDQMRIQLKPPNCSLTHQEKQVQGLERSLP